MPIEFSAFGRHDMGAKPLVLIAGPCVIESEEHVHRMASGIRQAVGEFVFNAPKPLQRHQHSVTLP